MNLSHCIFRVALVVTFVGNVVASENNKFVDKFVEWYPATCVVVASSSIFDKNGIPFSSRFLPRKHNKIFTKVLLGTCGQYTTEAIKNDRLHNEVENKVFQLGDMPSESRQLGITMAYKRAAGYAVVNGTLRLVADSYSLNEDYIDQKCDEHLSEDVAWFAKPIAKAAVDLAYHYVTIQLVTGIIHGINQSK